MSFRFKTILGIASIEAVLLSVLIWNGLGHLEKSSEEELIKRADAVATLFSSIAKEAVLASDLATLESIATEVQHTPGVVYTRILDGKGRALAVAGEKEALTRPFVDDGRSIPVSEDIYDRYQDISVADVVYGRVEIGLSLDAMRSAKTLTLQQTSAIALLEMALVALFSFLLGLYLTRQLSDLAEGARRLAEGDLGYQIPIRGSDELGRTAWAFNDMSRRIRDLVGKQERTVKELERLAFVAAHDLQEPLRDVVLNVQSVEKKLGAEVPNSAKRNIDTVVSSAHRMKNLINDLPRYLQINAKPQSFHSANAAEAVEGALDRLRHVIAAERARVCVGTMPKVYCDIEQLSLVFENILSNALKFKSPDREPEIEISALRNDAEWIFSIRDNGIGIKSDYTDKIFDVFRKLHPADQYPGTGIGLAIVRRIVERHDGRVWVESECDKGSTFFFSIPVKV